MNSLERVRAVITGQIPDRVPVCLHNFMMAAREAGIPMEKYRADPEAIAQAHLRAWEKYGHDCFYIDTDTTMLAEAMGAKSECALDEPGRIVAPAIHSLAEVDRLKVINPETERDRSHGVFDSGPLDANVEPVAHLPLVERTQLAAQEGGDVIGLHGMDGGAGQMP